eukprot:CAMPEP_0168168394 /NCGR_PEP_ID=MMETSP0139_2-20121125/3069_1 /TAXON_ID=44445 /ORGANISM="Pseudo-nitzschia australis, Strain 10249 10 AB" /LENGTH=61 /DNA_ID=CAMNT_0008085719 /DNA_START=449 /DNA_END=634 /DNA_ORIENTATION=+
MVQGWNNTGLVMAGGGRATLVEQVRYDEGANANANARRGENGNNSTNSTTNGTSNNALEIY